MFPVVAAAAGVGMCAQAIGKKFCQVSNPVLHEFWEAALQGNSGVVRQMIREHDIPADTRHHVSGASLVIELADARADSDARDRGLAAVLRTLAKARWCLAVRHRVTGGNALHLLACQPQHTHVVHRLKALLDWDLAHMGAGSMLLQTNFVDRLPEEMAPSVGDGRSVRVRLVDARHRVCFRVERTQQRLMWRAGWSNGAVVSQQGVTVTRSVAGGRVRLTQRFCETQTSAVVEVGIEELMLM